MQVWLPKVVALPFVPDGCLVLASVGMTFEESERFETITSVNQRCALLARMCDLNERETGELLMMSRSAVHDTLERLVNRFGHTLAGIRDGGVD